MIAVAIAGCALAYQISTHEPSKPADPVDPEPIEPKIVRWHIIEDMGTIPFGDGLCGYFHIMFSDPVDESIRVKIRHAECGWESEIMRISDMWEESESSYFVRCCHYGTATYHSSDIEIVQIGQNPEYSFIQI